MKKGILLLTVAAFAACGLQAQDHGNANQTSSTNSSAQSSSSAGPKEDAARLGFDMLDNTNKARTAIAHKNKQAALNDIETATNDLQKARKDENGKIIPLYQEFASVSVIAPVQAEQKKNAANSKASANSANAPATVHQVSGSYSVMEIDTDGATSHLNAAKKALNNGDWNTADRDLAAVQDGVVFASYKSDMPLVRAQENLMLARQDVNKGNYHAAHAALASSAKALAAYVQEGGPHANDAKNMQQEIQSYDQSIVNSHSDADNKINGWWNTASNWLKNPQANS